MNDLFKDTFTSRNRIFLVDNLPLPLYTPPTADALKQAMDQTKAELAQPPAQQGAVPNMNLGPVPVPISVGGKTRKGKKQKKSKTRKHKQRLPFGKR